MRISAPELAEFRSAWLLHLLIDSLNSDEFSGINHRRTADRPIRLSL
jgi:hypothetical protein